MREILFRGKRTDNGEWVTGTPFIYADRCKMIQAVAVHPDFVDEGNVYYSEGFPVDTKTVGQFTGLTDKNGKKIFEGDVVEVNHDAYPGVRGKVFFKNGSFMLKNVSDVLTLYGFLPWCEVTGNIHDNPELLEVSHV